MMRTRFVVTGLGLAGLLSTAVPARAGGLRFVESEFDSFPAAGGRAVDDKLLTSDGVKQLRPRQGLADGATQLALQGRGPLLRLPTGPLALPVTVQLANTETGVCWEAVYGNADRNDATQFRARSN